MTTPEKRIQETDKLLDTSLSMAEGQRTYEQTLLEQVLHNQRTLLQAVKVLLTWNEDY